MIEGTRNERVAILLASYIIGFITAYIAFGVVQLEDHVDFAQVSNQHMASVIASREQSSVSNAFIATDKEGLILIHNGERTLLSAVETASTDSLLQDGVHVAISDYSLSPDQSHVYFCEIPFAESDSCRPYLYSIDDGVVYPVEIQGERVAFATVGQEVTWSEDGALIVK